MPVAGHIVVDKRGTQSSAVGWAVTGSSLCCTPTRQLASLNACTVSTRDALMSSNQTLRQLMHAGKHGVGVAQEVLSVAVVLHGRKRRERLATRITHKVCALETRTHVR